MDFSPFCVFVVKLGDKALFLTVFIFISTLRMVSVLVNLIEWEKLIHRNYPHCQ